LKQRLKAEGNQTVTNCHGLKMLAEDGKMRMTDVADTEQLFRLIQSIPSPKAEQTRIATILSDMDNEITALETKLEKYKKVKLGIMQNLLTVKIRLV